MTALYLTIFTVNEVLKVTESWKRSVKIRSRAACIQKCLPDRTKIVFLAIARVAKVLAVVLRAVRYRIAVGFWICGCSSDFLGCSNFSCSNFSCGGFNCSGWLLFNNTLNGPLKITKFHVLIPVSPRSTTPQRWYPICTKIVLLTVARVLQILTVESAGRWSTTPGRPP